MRLVDKWLLVGVEGIVLAVVETISVFVDGVLIVVKRVQA